MDQSVLGSRVSPPRDQHNLAQLCVWLVALPSLVGRRSPHRRAHRKRAYRINIAGLYTIPVQPTTALLRFYYQSTRCRRRSCFAGSVPAGPHASGYRFPANLLATHAHGPRQVSPGGESLTGQDTPAHHRAAFGRGSGPLLVQFPHLA